jgi:hypothetical protein
MIDRARALAALLTEEHVDLEDLEDDTRVRELVSELAAPSTPLEVPATLARSTDAVETVIGILGLTGREALPDKWTGWAIRTLAKCLPAVEPFMYRLLLAHAAYPVICPVLSKIDEGIDRGELARFVTARMAGGETVTDEAFSRNVARRLATEIGDFVEEYGDERSSRSRSGRRP